MTTIFYLILSLTLLTLTTSQSPPTPSPSAGPQTLLEVLTPIFVPPNPASAALFTLQTVSFQTPIQIRYVTLFSISFYEHDAACNPRALSFFGVRDTIDPAFCKPLPKLKIFYYTFHRILEQEFPKEALTVAAFLRTNGLNPDSLSTDTSTEIGWANKVAFRARKYFRSDGWNSLGELNRARFRQPYSDFTGYKPVNLAQKPVSNLRRPLRWQPLVQSTDSTGLFSAQVHVLPHLGSAKLLALTQKDLNDRVSKSPYKNPNRRDTLGKPDRQLLERLIRKYFRASREITPSQRFEAAYWENKLFSLGAFIPFYAAIIDISDFEQSKWFVSEMIAQNDAVILAWREKRRHDLVRPTTIIRKLWKGRFVQAFVNADIGLKNVRAEEFEPLIKTQPHSEFPSASAVICEASLGSLRAAFRNKFGKNFTEPPFVLPVRSGAFRFLPDVGNFDLVYNNMREAAVSCGQSRLYAGVHFVPSVKEGLRLGRGIGKKAFKQMDALAKGIVPEDCARCLRSGE